MLQQAQVRKELMLKLSSNDAVISTVLDYTENKFTRGQSGYQKQVLPMVDEPFASTWRGYVAAAESIGVFAALTPGIVQFQFPVKENISYTQQYKAATLKGHFLNKGGMVLTAEPLLVLKIHEGFAGAVPVLIAGNTADFHTLIQALRYKNEPVFLPQSMGAAMIQGLNNWDRLHTYKEKWSLANPFGDWNAEFVKHVLPDKSSYQDKIMVLSRQGYSNVSGKDLGIDQQQWLDISLEIRLQHEYAHYFTLRYFGHMANNMHDELLADYAGINKVLGKFNASWFLHFIGLQDYPTYRQGGRLENYINKEKFSDHAFKVLCDIMYRASVNVEKFDEVLGSCKNDLDRSLRLLCLCETDLLVLADDDALTVLRSVYYRLQRI